MNSSFELCYDNGSEQLTFCKKGAFWLTSPPDLSSVQVEITGAQTAGQVGSVITAQSVRPKNITLTGAIIGDTLRNRQKLLRVVMPGKVARLTYRIDGKSWYVDGAPSHTPIVGAGDVVQDFQFQFHVPYPYWRTTEESVFSLAGLDRLFSFPFICAGRWYISEFSDSYTKVFVNEGNVPLEFELRIHALGEVSRPVLTHLGTGQCIRLERVLAPGQKLVVSTLYGKRGARLVEADGSETNAFRWLGFESDLAMRMLPGDNLLHFDAEDGRAGARVTLTAPKGVLSGV